MSQDFENLSIDYTNLFQICLTIHKLKKTNMGDCIEKSLEREGSKTVVLTK